MASFNIQTNADGMKYLHWWFIFPSMSKKGIDVMPSQKETLKVARTEKIYKLNL